MVGLSLHDGRLPDAARHDHLLLRPPKVRSLQ
jgi:hypothetical protein